MAYPRGYNCTCNKTCTCIYVVTPDGEILYKRDFYFDSAADWLSHGGAFGCGASRDDDGNFIGSSAVPNQAVEPNILLPQPVPMAIVRAWNATGDHTWDWANAPMGWDVKDINNAGTVVEEFRVAPSLDRAATDSGGTTVVAARKPLGQDNFNVPTWFGFSEDDRMYGIDDTGTQLWDFRVKDRIGFPYNLGPPNPSGPPIAPQFWQFNQRISVVAAGATKSLWSGLISTGFSSALGGGPPILDASGEYLLLFQVDNATGAVGWHLDIRPQQYFYHVGLTPITPGNWVDVLGVYFGPYMLQTHSPLATMAADDSVWIAIQGPLWGVPAEVTAGNPGAIYSTIFKLNSTGTGVVTSVVSKHISQPSQIVVSPDCSLLALVGNGDGVIDTDTRSWLEIYSISGTPRLISDFSGGTGSGAVQYLDSAHIATNSQIWTIDAVGPGTTGNYSRWRKWLDTRGVAGLLQTDGYSVWGGLRDCPPPQLVPDSGAVP